MFNIVNILLFVSICSCQTNVPVLLWAPNRLPSEFPILSALQSVSYQSFHESFVTSFQTDNIILFLQDELSVEDLSNHPNQLSNIEKWMDKSQSLFLPSVENPSFLQHDLASHGYEVISFQPGRPNAGLDLKNTSKNLVLVQLPRTRTNPSRSNALKKTDEIIESVMSTISAKADFIAIFTASKSSLETKNEIFRSRVKRQLETRELSSSEINTLKEENPGFHYSKCALLYSENPPIVNKIENGVTTTLDIPAETITDDGVSNCGENNAMIQLRFGTVNNISKLTIQLDFENIYRTSWFLSGAHVLELDDTHSTYDVFPAKRMLPVPLGSSYVCANNFLLKSKPNDDVKYSILFKGMQVQGFSNKRGIFGPPYDCVGFFSIPIWAGFITSNILILILTAGLLMLSNLKPVDKFDDPKGKHLVVAPTAAE